MNKILDGISCCGALPGPPVGPTLNVYQESMIMLSGALTIYLVADLRDLARSGKASIQLEDLEAPIKIETLMNAIQSNKDALIESGDYPDLESRLLTLEKLHNLSGGVFSWFLADAMKTKLVDFVDTDSEENLVHAITINKAQKRITVIFRGSVTKNDFITDAKVAQVKVDNPVYQIDQDSSPTINVHYGFNEYLFRKCPKTGGLSRYESIASKLLQLLDENEGFQVYCTGHSLGGALCTLFGFYAAQRIHAHVGFNLNPLKIISIASPYVGNVKFLLAFQSLERMGYLRHLRIANAEDLVTLSPALAPKLGLISPIMAMKNGVANMYKHCGMKLHMYDFKNESDCRFNIDFPQDQSSDEKYAKEIVSLIEDGKNFVGSIKLVFKKEHDSVLRFHSCEEYERRIEACKLKLANVTMEELYSDKAIVGDVLDKGYKPTVMLTAVERISMLKGSKVVQSAVQNAIKGGS